MSTWWLAIDKDYTSYAELKHRKVLAQGWPALGDLRTLCPLVENDEKQTFLSVISALEKIRYGPTERASKRMWNLLSFKAGDLIVGIEGTSVKGICEIEVNGWESYRYDGPEKNYNYAQTVGFPVFWTDWSPENFGFTPKAPEQSVAGVASLKADAQNVVNAWQLYKESHLKL